MYASSINHLCLFKIVFIDIKRQYYCILKIEYSCHQYCYSSYWWCPHSSCFRTTMGDHSWRLWLFICISSSCWTSKLVHWPGMFTPQPTSGIIWSIWSIFPRGTGILWRSCCEWIRPWLLQIWQSNSKFDSGKSNFQSTTAFDHPAFIVMLGLSENYMGTKIFLIRNHLIRIKKKTM